MLPYYLHVCEALDMVPDEDLVKELEEDNAKELAQLEEKLKDAEGNHGETEISEVLYSKAMFFTRIGNKVRALLADRDHFMLQISILYTVSAVQVD